MKKRLIKIMKLLLICVLILALITLTINVFMCQSVKKDIIVRGSYKGSTKDCIIVLGAAVRVDTPTYMLRDRLDLAYELYSGGYAKKILVSGDHLYDGYDEVNVMRQYLMNLGVKEEDIFMDHAGADTYTTMTRAKEIFKVKTCFISTQEYHLYRSVYLANKKGLDAIGIPCDVYISAKLPYFKFREAAARVKAFLYAEILKPTVTLGEEIPISGDGKATQDGLT